jgi:hypothetical protein
MIFRQKFLDGIQSGQITLAFRLWRRPSVKAGGTLLTPIGQLSIREVDPIDPQKITVREAKKAGFASRDELLSELESRGPGTVYRIKLGELRPDPRISLRAQVPTTDEELSELGRRLDRLDSYSPSGQWTLSVLKLINSKPAVRAGDLCKVMGQERDDFKVDVRKLKKLGLTESLDVGYRLSPRGKAVLKWLSRKASSGATTRKRKPSR